MYIAGFESIIIQILFIWFIANQIFGKKNKKNEEKLNKSSVKNKGAVNKLINLKTNLMDDLIKGLEDELGEFSTPKTSEPKKIVIDEKIESKENSSYRDPYFDKKVSLEDELLVPYKQQLDSDVVFSSDHLDSKLSKIPDFHSDTTTKIIKKQKYNYISKLKISKKSNLKKAIIIKEIFDKPIALRQFK